MLLFAKAVHRARLLIICVLSYLLCVSVACAATESIAYTIEVPKLPDGMSVEADFAVYSVPDDIMTYSGVLNLAVNWKSQEVHGFNAASLSTSIGPSGSFSLNFDTKFDMGQHGYFRIGNAGWANSLNVNPTAMAVGAIFAAGAWQDALLISEAEDSLGIGRVDNNTSFLSSAFYMSPRVSYYTPKVGNVQFGASLGYGGTPSRAFVLTSSGISRELGSEFNVEYDVLSSAAALYSSQYLDVSFGVDLAVSRMDTLTSGVSVGAKVKAAGLELAVSAGYLLNDPRIEMASVISDHHNNGRYIDVGVLYPLNDFRLGASTFIGRSYDAEGLKSSSVMVVMVGAEYLGSLSIMDVVPFAEIGCFRNHFADHTNTRIRGTETGALMSIGLKASIAL